MCLFSKTSVVSSLRASDFPSHGLLTRLNIPVISLPWKPQIQSEMVGYPKQSCHCHTNGHKFPDWWYCSTQGSGPNNKNKQTNVLSLPSSLHASSSTRKASHRGSREKDFVLFKLCRAVGYRILPPTFGGQSRTMAKGYNF